MEDDAADLECPGFNLGTGSTAPAISPAALKVTERLRPLGDPTAILARWYEAAFEDSKVRARPRRSDKNSPNGLRLTPRLRERITRGNLRVKPVTGGVR
jgi:hypothetical protein